LFGVHQLMLNSDTSFCVSETITPMTEVLYSPAPVFQLNFNLLSSKWVSPFNTMNNPQILFISFVTKGAHAPEVPWPAVQNLTINLVNANTMELFKWVLQDTHHTMLLDIMGTDLIDIGPGSSGVIWISEGLNVAHQNKIVILMGDCNTGALCHIQIPFSLLG
jgi:hypothetical protein